MNDSNVGVTVGEARSLKGWVIVYEGQRAWIGRIVGDNVNEAAASIRLRPAYHYGFKMAQVQGGLAPAYEVNCINYFAGVDEIVVRPGAVFRLDHLTPEERDDLLDLIAGAEEQRKKIRSAQSGIELATRIPKSGVAH